MRITLFDYGAGNLHSLAKALAAPDRTVHIATDPRTALRTDLLVLPGVGAFAPAARALASARAEMREAIMGGLPMLGICLGMQLLFEGSDEGVGEGLGVFDGRVTLLDAVRRPQMGWNTLEDASGPLFGGTGIREAYYANGYACRPDDLSVVTAWSTHEGDRFPAAVRRDRCLGVQFHPEKSSAPGIRFLDAFIGEVASSRSSPTDTGS